MTPTCRAGARPLVSRSSRERTLALRLPLVRQPCGAVARLRSVKGIPIGLDQVLGMQEEADEMGVSLPWERINPPSKL